MGFLLEATNHYPPEAIAVGVTTFGALVAAALGVILFGSHRPHAKSQ